MFNISFFANYWANKTDEFLVQATQSGESAAFEAIYEKYHKAIYSYLWNVLNYNYTDATSVTSDVFIKLYEYIKKKEIRHLKSTLYRIAHTTAIDYLRLAQQNVASLDEGLDIADIYSEKDVLNTEFKKHLLQSLLQQLDVQYREVLYLYYQESKSYEEIAQIVNLNKNTVGTLVFKAKKSLQMMAKRQGITEALLS